MSGASPEVSPICLAWFCHAVANLYLLPFRILAFGRNGMPFSRHSGVFADARENGYDTAVITIAYHLYCRRFQKQISRCWIDDTVSAWRRKTVFSEMGNVVGQVLRRVPYLNRVFFQPRRSLGSQCGVHLHHAFREQIKSVTADPSNDFVFVHWLLPDMPFIYDYEGNRYVYDERFPMANLRSVLAAVLDGRPARPDQIPKFISYSTYYSRQCIESIERRMLVVACGGRPAPVRFENVTSEI